MEDRLQFYIGGGWVDPLEPRRIEVIDPSREAAFARISLGSAADVERAVAAARAAFPAWSAARVETRLYLFERMLGIYRRRQDEIADVLSREMGAPITFARGPQSGTGVGQLRNMIEVLKTYAFDRLQGTTLITREPIGVVGLITPWNWPIHQLVCKVLPAMAAGCTMVLKPSEIAPLSAMLFADVVHEAGVPSGVFNLINGDGPGVGQAIAAHPDVDMVSFTGSTRAGVAIARAAAPTVKRVCQELGGKSPNLILPDADLDEAVRKGVLAAFRNTGQSCSSASRMLVHAGQAARAAEIAAETAREIRIGDPADPATGMGPLVSAIQFDKVQRLIVSGIDEGARLVEGGPGRPAGIDRGWFVRPTVFADVGRDMTIAREEIFGPVLTILTYRDEDEAVEIANDTVYGLVAHVQSRDLAAARRVARRLRAGNVLLNYPAGDPNAPFGGYRQSGNGREFGVWGLEDYLEIKAVIGHGADEGDAA